MPSYGPTHCWNTSPVYKIAAYVLSIRLPTFYYKKYYQERCSAAWFSQNELCRMSKCFRLFSLIPSSNIFKMDERGSSLFWSSLMVLLLNYGSNWENNFILELEKKKSKIHIFFYKDVVFPTQIINSVSLSATSWCQCTVLKIGAMDYTLDYLTCYLFFIE